MSTSSELDHLADLLAAAKQAQDYLGASSKDEFRSNNKDRDSVNYKFMVMGEAANRLGKDFHRRHPAVPWKDLIGMRNIVAHQYGRVDPNIVWDAVKTRLLSLIEYIEGLVRGSGNDDLGGPAGGSGGTGSTGIPGPLPSSPKDQAPRQPPSSRSGPKRPPSSKKSKGWER